VSNSVAVMGTGSWGTAFAKVLDENQQRVNFWGNSSQVINDIQSSGTNSKYFSNIHFSQRVSATSDPEIALREVQLVAIAVPMQRLRSNLEIWAKHVPSDAIILSLIKGIEHNSGKRVSDLVAEYLPNPFSVLSGPNLAAEIADNQIAAATVAAIDESIAISVQEICSSNSFRLFRSQDVIGVEIAGTTKNIIALATGIVIGLGLGENAQAAIMTRGLAEMAAIGIAAGGKRDTFLGLAGIGDLIATSQSPHSRNRSFGVLLGQGHSVLSAKNEIGQTVEAMQSTQPILTLANSHNLSVPIIEQVAKILAGSSHAESILEIFDTNKHEIEHY
jgi:glycerol-3-phosphate dehydrogenase (NAD(P)+)